MHAAWFYLLSPSHAMINLEQIHGIFDWWYKHLVQTLGVSIPSTDDAGFVLISGIFEVIFSPISHLFLDFRSFSHALIHNFDIQSGIHSSERNQFSCIKFILSSFWKSSLFVLANLIELAICLRLHSDIWAYPRDHT